MPGAIVIVGGGAVGCPVSLGAERRVRAGMSASDSEPSFLANGWFMVVRER